LRFSCTIQLSSSEEDLNNPFFAPRLEQYLRRQFWSYWPLYADHATGKRLVETNVYSEVENNIRKHVESLPSSKHLLQIDQYVHRQAKMIKQSAMLYTANVLDRARQQQQEEEESETPELLETETWDRRGILGWTSDENTLRKDVIDVMQRLEEMGKRPTYKTIYKALLRHHQAQDHEDPLQISSSAWSSLIHGRACPKHGPTLQAIRAWVTSEQAGLSATSLVANASSSSSSSSASPASSSSNVQEGVADAQVRACCPGLSASCILQCLTQTCDPHFPLLTDGAGVSCYCWLATGSWAGSWQRWAWSRPWAWPWQRSWSWSWWRRAGLIAT
jgi:hypothetical protein